MTKHAEEIPQFGPFSKLTLYGASGGTVLGFLIWLTPGLLGMLSDSPFEARQYLNIFRWGALRSFVGIPAAIGGFGGLGIGFLIDTMNRSSASEERPPTAGPGRRSLEVFLLQWVTLALATAVLITMTIYQQSIGPIRPHELTVLFSIAIAGTVIGITIGGWLWFRQQRRSTPP